MNLFNWIDELFVGKRDWNSFSESDQKKFSPFMVNRYLSMGSDYLQIVNYNSNTCFGIINTDLDSKLKF